MSETTKAHGLDGSLVEPDWPPLTVREVESVLANYPQCSGPFDLLTVSPRPFSAASVIAAGDHRIFLKRHASAVREPDALREEHRFMSHLRQQGVEVPRVFVTAAGDSVVANRESVFELHSVPPGCDYYEDAISWTPFASAAHAHSAGRTLATLHRASEGFAAPGRSSRPLVASFTIFSSPDPPAAWDDYVEQRPSLSAYLRSHDCRQDALELLMPFYSALQPHLNSMKPLWTHNDLHASNLFWSNRSATAKATAVIDFGLCDCTTAVHDVAQAIERNVVEWLVLMNDPEHPQNVPVHVDQMWALLEGYQAIRPLAFAERQALAPMLALCHAEFALSEADYFLSVLHDEEKARVACEDYLLEHARWWHTAGAPLLNSLRAWAEAAEPRPGERPQ